MNKTIFFMTVFCVNISVCWATLGEHENSVSSDRKAFSMVKRGLTDTDFYHVHEISNDAVTIREYASLEGVIFAVSWTGLHRPDLNALLGKYFKDYQSSSEKTPKIPGMRAYRLVQGRGVVVQMSGHMRSMQGIAYVPALVPQGVNIHEIQ